MNASKKIAIGAAAGLTSLGIGLGVSSVALAEPTPSPGGSASAAATPSTDGGQKGAERGGRGHRGGHGGHGAKGVGDVAAFAEKLGVDETDLKTALGEIRAERKADSSQTKPKERPSAEERETRSQARQAELAKALAEKLDVDEDTVTQALEGIEAERTAERASAMKSRLDQAVADGTLTQAEADAVRKATEAGVIGGRGPR